ncbi:MAG: G1 family endopeptidase [Thermaerobacter sp.]|nr:G1 family endopeptidase [Thermaerobacter sp.]
MVNLRRIRFRGGLAAWGAAVVLAAAGLAPLTAGAAPLGAGPMRVAPGGAVRGTLESLNWAGYVVTAPHDTAVSATWQVPAVTPPPDPGYSATWVGIGGFQAGDRTLIQAGTLQEVVNGRERYLAWWETLPRPMVTIPMTVAAGDRMSVAVTHLKGRRWRFTVQDVTRAETFRKVVHYRSKEASAEWIEEDPAGGNLQLLPLADFGAATFQDGLVTTAGVTGSIASQPHTGVIMVDAQGAPEVTVSPLSANGESFTADYLK